MDIKKAFNQFKKDAAKELSFSISGCCYMTMKQIANGTATITLCNDIPYEQSIKRLESDIKRVSTYQDSWTEEEIARSVARSEKEIEFYKSMIEKYGTRGNEANHKYLELVSSDSFAKLQQSVDFKISFELEKKYKWAGLNDYQIRLHY